MDNASVEPRLMSLHLLEKITNNFSQDRKLGAGSYGNVYKGVHTDGQTIAVKVLHYFLGHDDEHFEKEYLNLASLRHKNIVQLVGYCHETQRECLPYNGKMVFAERTTRALCFEYMHNGSLDNYLSDESNGLDWQTRYGIIKGICEGLKYLHEEVEPPMYHLDLKPANVLLDENMVPRIADFGLSRLFGGEQTQVTKSTIGTPGYIPPEYIDAAIISIKFDIYGLGVVIIKIMTGREGYFRSAEMSSEQFIELVHGKWRNRLQATSMLALESYSEQVKRCIEIALSCVKADRCKRPSIGVIINKLSETETIIQFPAALRKDTRSPMDQICHCICTDSKLLDIWPKKLVNYPLYLTDNRGRAHEVTVRDPSGERTTFEPIRPNRIKIIRCRDKLGQVISIDAHPTEPWILVGHLGWHASIWNHLTQAREMTLDFTDDNGLFAAKFIAREQWLVAGDSDGYIHVRTYRTTDNYKPKIFKAHASRVSSLAVHPRDPFVLSASADRLIKLWNWETGWECIRTFEAHSNKVQAVKFNPQIVSNTFASASRDSTVKIWRIFSPVPIATLDCSPDEVQAVDYFFPGVDGRYMVTGSSLGTARIWDLRTQTCIHRIKGLKKQYARNVAVVNCLPEHPILITASEDGVVSFCDSNTHRYENMIDFKLGKFWGCQYIEGTGSLAIAFDDGIAVMDISPQRSSS